MPPTIKIASDQNLIEVLPILKESFTKHNIFAQELNIIKEYVTSLHHKNLEWGGGFLVAVQDNKVIGGMLIKKTEEDQIGKHYTVKYNHIVVHKKHMRKGIGSELVKYADALLRSLIKTGTVKTVKVEVKVSENEKQNIVFFEKHGFTLEGTLSSHFRHDEKVYVLGKEIF